MTANSGQERTGADMSGQEGTGGDMDGCGAEGYSANAVERARARTHARVPARSHSVRAIRRCGRVAGAGDSQVGEICRWGRFAGAGDLQVRGADRKTAGAAGARTRSGRLGPRPGSAPVSAGCFTAFRCKVGVSGASAGFRVLQRQRGICGLPAPVWLPGCGLRVSVVPGRRTGAGQGCRLQVAGCGLRGGGV